MVHQHQLVAIEHGGMIYTFINDDENLDFNNFYEKCWFKVKNAQRFDNPDLLEELSQVWVTKKMTGAIYDDHLEATLKEMSPIYCVPGAGAS